MFAVTLTETALAQTGGEFNATPFIIGAIVLVVLGGAALIFMRVRGGKNSGDPGDPHDDYGSTVSAAAAGTAATGGGAGGVITGRLSDEPGPKLPDHPPRGDETP